MSNDSFFNNDWLELQRKYWDSWSEMGRKAMGLENQQTLTTPWEGALDHWWKAMSPATPDFSKTFMEKMMEQGKNFFRMAETFANTPEDTTATNGLTWWTKALEDMQKQFSGSLDDGGNSMQRMMSFWELPIDNWQRMMSSMSPMPGDMLRNMPHEQLKDRFDRALSAPGLGYTREEQSQYQELTRTAMDYQAALQEYTGFYSQLGMKSVERMGDFIQGVIDSGKSIDSARTLYDNWISCCETVYAAEVATPEYAQIHGRLVNAQMALKRRMAIMVDENLGAMNMPTRSELRTLQDRLQETRRDNKQLHRALHALEKQVAALSGKTPTTALKAPAPATKATEKPATRATTRRKTAAKPTGGTADD
ncbi:class III poly(R)-hydroxyalkanoic acid synthase subunit PhaE [Thiocystis violacea]|uniref:class III poly(R)-hydroxyalkanoic acid synthase subunit PhaE n=1 Tax=Thiocystis violacea TaxID=13725 RepID=UPI000016FF9C|nr:class III poly(R)-hydroxyalkanoic acid synthase subunit PhaE [Thiocystis violacea]AAC60429.2 orf2 5' to phbC [Thiocystis violacea]MBK1722417.1 class III poly(R)-hydroxyalkanoic acid synthase subunit PhaE [Thiocystis violacea]